MHMLQRRMSVEISLEHDHHRCVLNIKMPYDHMVTEARKMYYQESTSTSGGAFQSM